MKRNLVISAVGDRSVHGSWIRSPAEASFDLFLVYYGDDPAWACDRARFRLRRKGFKYEHLHHLSERFASELREYERIWCPDDDVYLETTGVNRLFELFEAHRLQLAQPAIADGEYSYAALCQRREYVLRYSPYVEVMCPIFTREAFFRVRDTFLENRSGWGIDWVWPKRFARREIAILDAVGVRHTGRLGAGEHYRRLAELGIDPQADFEATVARHGGIDWSVHRRMVRGELRMRGIKRPDSRGWLERLREALRSRRPAH